jgi:hypothetical protein
MMAWNNREELQRALKGPLVQWRANELSRRGQYQLTNG